MDESDIAFRRLIALCRASRFIHVTPWYAVTRRARPHRYRARDVISQRAVLGGLTVAIAVKEGAQVCACNELVDKDLLGHASGRIVVSAGAQNLDNVWMS